MAVWRYTARKSFPAGLSRRRTQVLPHTLGFLRQGRWGVGRDEPKRVIKVFGAS